MRGPTIIIGIILLMVALAMYGEDDRPLAVGAMGTAGVAMIVYWFFIG